MPVDHDIHITLKLSGELVYESRISSEVYQSLPQASKHALCSQLLAEISDAFVEHPNPDLTADLYPAGSSCLYTALNNLKRGTSVETDLPSGTLVLRAELVSGYSAAGPGVQPAGSIKGSTVDTVSVVIQIGNSDDKLTQARWSEFCFDTRALIAEYSRECHFSGTSSGDASWQNACWCFVIPAHNLPRFKQDLTSIRQRFNQDSVAILVGQTEFI